LNKTTFKWTDYTWNPITGCLHGCEYCYARKKATNPFFSKGFPYGFKPTFYPDRLGQPLKLKKPSKIFTVDMGDMFGDWVPAQWILDILAVMEKCPQHTFQILTKNPKRLQGFTYPENVWLGITVDEQKRTAGIVDLLKANSTIHFVSFEPLLEKIDCELHGLDWIIIGARTKPLLQPQKEWVESILRQARELGIAVFLKNNLQWLVKIQEFPKTKIDGRCPLQHIAG